MKKLYLSLFAFSLLTVTSKAQMKIGASTAPAAASILELESTTQGFVLPRVSLTDVTSNAPLGGTILTSTMVYNTNAGATGGSGVGVYYWDGLKWNFMANATSTTLSVDNGLNNTANAPFIELGGILTRATTITTTPAYPLTIASGGTTGGGLNITANALSSGSAFGITSTSALINGGSLFSLSSTGATAGNTAYGITAAVSGANTKNVGTTISATGATTNVGGNFSASGGTNNYAIIVPNGGGNVGLGTNTPNAAAILDLSGNTTTGIYPTQVALTATNAALPTTLPPTSLLVYNTATAGASPNNVTPGYYYNAGTAAAPNWVRLFSGNGSANDAWLTLGNGGTSPGTFAAPGTNFIGTTDNIDWAVRTSNIERMRFGSTANGGTVAINGAPVSTQMLTVLQPTASSIGITGSNTAVSGTGSGSALGNGGIGVKGTTIQGTQASSPYNAGAGVWGQNTNSTGTGIIGVGQNATPVYLIAGGGGAFTGTSNGVFGYATTASGIGVYGSELGATGTGVYGFASGTTGDNSGVEGEAASSIGEGVFGYNSAAAGTNAGYGVWGVTNQKAGASTNTINTPAGVWGYSQYGAGQGQIGVVGSYSSSGYGVGVLGLGYGGVFSGNLVTATDFGVLGQAGSSVTHPLEVGVAGYYGTFTTTNAVPQGNAGLYGASANSAVYALYAYNTTGNTGAGLRVNGTSNLIGVTSLGTASSIAGSLVFNNTNAFTTTIIPSSLATASSTLTLPTAPATTNGQVLTSTTAGVLSWGSGTSVMNTENGINVNTTAPASVANPFIELGGALIRPTTISDDNINTLALSSTATTSSAFNISANNLTTGSALNLNSTGVIAAGGNLAAFTANSATTGNLLNLSGTALTTGSALNIAAGTTTGNAIALAANGITTGAGISETVNGLTTGSALKISSTSTSINNGSLVNISSTGASAGNTVTGLNSTVTGASGTNVAGYFSASGASTNNIAINTPAGGGQVLINQSAPVSTNLQLSIKGSSYADNQVSSINLFAGNSSINASNTGGAAISQIEAGFSPLVYRPDGYCQVQLVVYYHNNNAGTINLQLQTINSGGTNYPVVNSDPWTFANTSGSATNGNYIATSPWKDVNLGTSALEAHLFMWVQQNSIDIKNVYLLIRPKNN